MTTRLKILGAAALIAAFILARSDGTEETGAVDLPTRAESSGFTETTLFTELLEFLHILDEKGDTLRVEFFGESAEGRPLPLAILGNPAPEDPKEIDRDRTTVLFIQANIHAGEVAGKEASLMLMREIVNGSLDHLVENTVLLVAPVFNADGNELVSKDNRPRQNGPAGGVGTRANAQNLDLNRDFMKAESPEVCAHLSGVVLRWNPDLLVDCHTTNGSLHTEPISYAWTQNPLADAALRAFDRDVMMPAIAADTRTRDGYASIPYGFWADRRDRSKGWRSFGPQLRFGTNYWGLRNRHAILIEMYAYASFETRVRACRAFLRSILEFSRKEGDAIRALVREADARAAAGDLGLFHWRFAESALDEPITIMGYEPVKRSTNAPPKKPKMPAGEPIAYSVPCLANYDPVSEGRPLPVRGYVFPRGNTMVRDKLLQHGILVEQIAEETAAEVSVFEIDEIIPSKRPYQGHWTQTFKGKWVVREKTIKAGSHYVPSAQPLAMLTACLLEPECDDSLGYWNFLDRYLTKNAFDSSLMPFPIWRW